MPKMRISPGCSEHVNFFPDTIKEAAKTSKRICLFLPSETKLTTYAGFQKRHWTLFDTLEDFLKNYAQGVH